LSSICDVLASASASSSKGISIFTSNEQCGSSPRGVIDLDAQLDQPLPKRSKTEKGNMGVTRKDDVVEKKAWQYRKI